MQSSFFLPDVCTILWTSTLSIALTLQPDVHLIFFLSFAFNGKYSQEHHLGPQIHHPLPQSHAVTLHLLEVMLSSIVYAHKINGTSLWSVDPIRLISPPTISQTWKIAHRSGWTIWVINGNYCASHKHPVHNHYVFFYLMTSNRSLPLGSCDKFNYESFL